MPDSYSPKERVIKTINHEQPDRVPIYFTITPQVAERLGQHLGIPEYTHPDAPHAENRISYTELLLELGNDVVGIGPCAPKAHPTRTLEDGTLITEWQIKYKTVGLYNEMVEHPLAHAETEADIKQFTFPDPLAEGRFDHAKATVAKYGERYAICGDIEATIFEAAWALVGMEKFFMDFAMQKPYVFALFDRIMEYSLGVAKEMVRLGADIIWLGDDVGAQDGMLISPLLWRKTLKDRLHYIITELKREKPELKIAYHCCGSYFSIMEELIEFGVDILNALQPTAANMDLATIKNTFGAKASLFGGVDTQKVLPFGSLNDIEEEVQRVMTAAAQGGGYIIAGAHNIQPDTSTEKIVKLFEWSKKYGDYSRVGHENS